MNKKTALITGGNSGIGFELAKLFAKDEYDLVLVARNHQKLKDCAGEINRQFGVKVKIIVKDLSSPSAPEEIFSELQNESIHVDFLVNNAGFNVYGTFSETNLKNELQLLQVNIVSLTHLTKLFLPAMLKQGFGMVLNVGSTGSFMPVTSNTVYCASKGYVLLLSEGIAEDLGGTGVTVTALCPGAMRTSFIDKAGMKNTNLFNGSLMEPEKAAKIGYHALMKGRRVVVPGFRNKYQIFLVRVSPRILITKIGKIIMSEKTTIWTKSIKFVTSLGL